MTQYFAVCSATLGRSAQGATRPETAGRPLHAHLVPVDAEAARP
ncbi:hypothetical protein PC116_g14139 [Phytophthora cactorum]|uniref:Uncharacterized protein n=1 Tax=Phytophthora cactorum TaxID=29920 RepID=A0A8T1KRS1_9STRA|nr:hypothetical protein PC114_g12995 [Phytophthora cactorum]KAG2923037.1 hypothetical protein PC117_g15829 [Phytophthora cactorum]KAG3009013.1 hypothetical protein PC120_g15875 [Phytophthora cactorum]KAG3031873.1 hypothetical protein PC119_g5850 [Phytophthora cactorum]KAG3194072.1 hypothetical protein PC128_g9683 [Phytophthora cactorum]